MDGGGKLSESQKTAIAAAAKKIAETPKKSVRPGRAPVSAAIRKKFVATIESKEDEIVRKKAEKDVRTVKLLEVADMMEPEKSCASLFKSGTSAPAILKNLSQMTREQLQLLARCVDHPHDHCGCPDRSTRLNCLRVTNHAITSPMAELLGEGSQPASSISFNRFVAGIHEDNTYIYLSDIETSFRELLEVAHPSIMGICDHMEDLKKINVKFVKHMTYTSINASTIADTMMRGRGAADMRRKKELVDIPVKCLTIINDIDAANERACAAVGEYIHLFFSRNPSAPSEIYVLNDGNAGVKHFMKQWSGFIQKQTTQVYMDSATNSKLLDNYISLTDASTHVYDWFTFTEPMRGRTKRVADITVSTIRAGTKIGLEITCQLNNVEKVISETIPDYEKYTNGPTLDYIARLTDAISRTARITPENFPKIIDAVSQRGVWPMKKLLVEFVKAYKSKPSALTQDLLDFISDWKTFGDGEISRQARQSDEPTLVVSVDQNSSTCMRLLGQDGVYSHKNKHDMFRSMGTPVATAGQREIMRLNILCMVFQTYISIMRSLVFPATTRAHIKAKMNDILKIIHGVDICGTVATTDAGIYAQIMKLGDVYHYLQTIYDSVKTVNNIVTAGGEHYSTFVTIMEAHEKHISSIMEDILQFEHILTANHDRLKAMKYNFPTAVINYITGVNNGDAPFVGLSIIEFNDAFQQFLELNVLTRMEPMHTIYKNLRSVGRIIRIRLRDKDKFYNAFNFSFDISNVYTGFNYAPEDFINIDTKYKAVRDLLRIFDRGLKKTKFQYISSDELTLTTQERKYFSIYEFTDALKNVHDSFKDEPFKVACEDVFKSLYENINNIMLSTEPDKNEQLIIDINNAFMAAAMTIRNMFPKPAPALNDDTNMSGGGSVSKFTKKEEDDIRASIASMFGLLAELHIAAPHMPLINVESIHRTAVADSFKPRSNAEIRADPNYKKIISARGKDIAEFADKFFSIYSRVYTMHDLINTVDMDTLEMLYLLENGMTAAPATVPMTASQAMQTKIKSEIKATEAHLDSLRNSLARTQRQRNSSRSHRSAKTSFQPILSAIKEEYESPAESRSPERAAGLWADVKSFLKKGAQLSQAEKKTLGTLLGMAEKAGDRSKDVLKVRTLATGQSKRRTRRSAIHGSRSTPVH